MKGKVVHILFVMVGVLILLFVSLVMLSPLREVFDTGSTEALTRWKIRTHYTFEVSDILKGPEESKYDFNKFIPTAGTDPEDAIYRGDTYEEYFHGYDPIYGSSDGPVHVTDDPGFCRDLRKCIRESVMSGEKCEIEITFPQTFRGSPFYDYNIYNDTKDAFVCPSVQIYEQEESEYEEEQELVRRQVCKFDADKGWNLKHYNFLYYDYPHLDSSAKPSPSSNWDEVERHMPYLYNGYIYEGFDNMDDSDEPVDNIAFFSMPGYPEDDLRYGYEFGNYRSGGKIKIIVYDAGIHTNPERTCNFSMMVVPQPALAETVEDVTFEIFKLTYYPDLEMLQRGNSVRLYNVKDYKGTRRQNYYKSTRYVGDYMDQRTSAIKIYGDISVRLWKHDDFEGTNRLYLESDNYIGEKLNDEVSSLEIIPEQDIAGIFGSYPRFYNHTFEDGEYRPTLDEVVESLRTGFMEWNKIHYRHQAIVRNIQEDSNAEFVRANQNQWYLFETGHLIGSGWEMSYDTDCWNDDFFINGGPNFEYDEAVPWVYYNGISNDVSNNPYSELKIVVAYYKKEIEDEDVYYYGDILEDYDSFVVTPYITICAK